MSVQQTAQNTVPGAVPDTVPEAFGKPSGTDPRPFSLLWMQTLALVVMKILVERGINFQRFNYRDNEEIIRKIIFEVRGIKTWAKSRAWKKYDLKKFYTEFVVPIKNKVRGIVPLKLPKTPSGKFNKEAFRIVAEKLKDRILQTQKNEEAFRRNALKMFGLKKWDRSKFQGKLTFLKFFKNYVLFSTRNINICRREGDFHGVPRDDVFSLGFSIDYRHLSAINFVVPDLSHEDVCTLCLESIDPSDPNKIFVSACNHKFHYECVRVGYEHLFVNEYRKKFKCPNCRQHSNCGRVVPNHEMHNQQANWRF